MRLQAKLLKNYQVELVTRGHHWLSDEPLASGGDDVGPNPFDLLLSSLAACKVITVQMYAQRKGWQVEAIDLDLDIREIKASECDDCQSEGSEKVNIIDVVISFEGDLTPEQHRRLAEIADRCPVHRTLTREIKIRSQLFTPLVT
jgi:putative redox protein